MAELFSVQSDMDKVHPMNFIAKASPPFRVYAEPVLPKATVSQYEYLFGVVYPRIMKYTGMNKTEVHRAFMIQFNLEYMPHPSGLHQFRLKSASEFTTIDMAEYTEIVKAEALNEWGIIIEEPEELFVGGLR